MRPFALDELFREPVDTHGYGAIATVVFPADCGRDGSCVKIET